jgi:hypothetical protein
MDKERVEKILELATRDEKLAVTTLFNGAVVNLKAYQDENTKSRLQDWQATEHELEKLVERLESRYLTGVKQFKSIMHALRYLKDDGWKIEKSKLYKDRDSGLLAVNADKSVDEVVVLAYAAKYLDKVAATGSGDGGGALAEDKLNGEIAYNALRKKKLEFELAKEKGQYIHRSRWLAELVSKLSASKYAVLQVARYKAPELISAVGGDLKKEAVFTELFGEYIEDVFNELAMVPELKFLVKS